MGKNWDTTLAAGNAFEVTRQDRMPEALPQSPEIEVTAVQVAIGSVAASSQIETEGVRIPSDNWQDDANCLGVDPDLFFPERGASTREAKEVCRGCFVRLDCLEYALTGGEKFGIWGGKSERERRRMRRQRAQVARQTFA